MPISNHDIREIAAQAAPLFDRLGPGFVAEPTEPDDPLIIRRYEKWKLQAARDDQTQFSRRLAWDNLTEESVRKGLGAVRLKEGEALPDWAKTLSEVIKGADRISEADLKSKNRRFLDHERPIVFEAFFIPFIDLATARIREHTGSNYRLLISSAHAFHERSLLLDLAQLAGKVLYLEYSVFRYKSGRDVALERRISGKEETASTTMYQAFITSLFKGGMIDLFKEYAVLGRLMAISIDYWVEASVEFITRLASDIKTIQSVFFDREDIGKISEIYTGLSDAHNRGRSVMIVVFKNGRKLVYKPKAMGMEHAYSALLNHLNEQQAPYHFRALNVLERQEYGWIEFVEPLPCRNPEDICAYYRHTGALICLLYALGSTDVHSENIIACADQPLLIDMETVMYPALNIEEYEDNAWWLAGDQLRHSVLNSGFLPRWQIGVEGKAYDVSALGYEAQEETDYRRRKWEGMNSDNMWLEYTYGSSDRRPNAPFLKNEQVRFEAHREDVLEGFKTMYRFLAGSKEKFASLIEPFRNQEIRYINHATELYAALLKKTMEPEYLRDGAERSIQFEILCRHYLNSTDRPRLWPIVEAERRQLENMDVPYFLTNSERVTLPLHGASSIDYCFKQSGYEVAEDRLAGLNEADLQRQQAIMRASFIARSPEINWKREEENTTDGAPDVDPLTREEKIEIAQNIAADLAAWSIAAPDGSVAWTGLDLTSNSEQYQITVLGSNLYSGSLGICFFLAALEQVCGGAGYRDIALGGIEILRQALREEDKKTQTFKRWKLGGGMGLGSAVYALARMGTFLEEPALVEEAVQIADLFEPERIHDDADLDILSGAAGGILGLLALYDQTGQVSLLDRAMSCGNHLLEHRIDSVEGIRTWRTRLQVNGPPLTGFLHGTAGIAYALLALYYQTGDTACRDAALEGIAYENQVYSESHQNWPDFRPLNKGESAPDFPTAWCHGAPGIGLARLAGRLVDKGEMDMTGIDRDIDRALQTTVHADISGDDHLCCGTFGRIDFLFTAGRALQRTVLTQTAESFAARTIRRAETAEAFRFPVALPHNAYNPSLFRGVAGIGYQLLRMAEPDRLPSVLTLS